MGIDFHFDGEFLEVFTELGEAAFEVAVAVFVGLVDIEGHIVSQPLHLAVLFGEHYFEGLALVVDDLLGDLLCLL